MRIDKFIWAVRFFKTRALASKECNSDKIKINADFVKPSKLIKVGDTIEVKHYSIWLKYQILEIPKSRVGAKLVETLIKDLSSSEDIEQLQQVQLINRQNKILGIKGRPTKKDRRNLDDIIG